MLRSSVVLLCAILCALAAHASQAAIGVSIIRLIATPESFDGKLVRIVGYLDIQFEGNAIYVHEEDCKMGISKNGLWINVPRDKAEELAKLRRQYVLMEGFFDASSPGMWSGGIASIHRVQPWPSYRSNR